MRINPISGYFDFILKIKIINYSKSCKGKKKCIGLKRNIICTYNPYNL